MITKLFLCPWFGPLPPWMPTYLENVKRLKSKGYVWLIDHDLKRFKARCKDRLGVDCPIEPGGGKVHDFRAVLSVIYADEIAGYDFWGHTDFDCVYGNPANFADDEILASVDLWTDGWDYVNGPWSLYRNTPTVNILYASILDWQDWLEDPRTSGWVEKEYSSHVRARLGDQMHITNLQTKNLDNFDTLRFRDDELWEGDHEVLFAHFRRVKEYPRQLL